MWLSYTCAHILRVTITLFSTGPYIEGDIHMLICHYFCTKTHYTHCHLINSSRSFHSHACYLKAVHNTVLKCAAIYHVPMGRAHMGNSTYALHSCMWIYMYPVVSLNARLASGSNHFIIT